MTPHNTPAKDFDVMVSDEPHLAKLSEWWQRLLRMRYVELLTYKQISAATDKPIGTIKSGLNRACAQVRKLREEAACPSS